MLFFIIFYMIFHNACGVIHRINRTEYQKFPPLYHLDDYDLCLSEPEGVYCAVEINLVSDGQSDLLSKIQEYSALRNKHFNHSVLNYGVCATIRCHKYIENNSWDPKTTLEACFNESLWQSYQLKAKLSDRITCRRHSENIETDSLDIFARTLFSSILLLSIFGSVYEVCWNKNNQNNGIFLFEAFSVIRNFRKLFDQKLPSKVEFKAITGLRTLLVTYLVIYHSGLGLIASPTNTYIFEVLFHQNIINFTWFLPVQGCFVLSSFLLTNKLQELQEKYNLSWIQIIKLMYLRWLRLIPPVAVLLLFIFSWFRNILDGPFWHRIVSAEIRDCKRDWWRYLLGLNNYVDTACLIQTWYMAADFQFYLVTMLVCRLIFVSKRKQVILASMFLLAMLFPALHTYYQDYDAFAINSPEASRSVFTGSSSVPPVYRWGHTNMSCSVIGIMLSFFVNRLMKTKFDIHRFKIYRVLYWCTVPVMAVLIMLGSLITEETPRPPLLFRSIYAALVKPLFGFCIAFIVFGAVFKIEDYFRGILEWHGWKILNELNFSAFLIQMVVIKALVGSRPHLTYLTTFNAISEVITVTLSIYIAAFIFWILVEAPLQEITKKYLSVEITTKKYKKVE